jgi:oxalate decarboxylase
VARSTSLDEFAATKTTSGGLTVIMSGKQRNLHWHTNASEWNYYLRGKVFNVNPGDAVYIPAGFGLAVRNS